MAITRHFPRKKYRNNPRRAKKFMLASLSYTKHTNVLVPNKRLTVGWWSKNTSDFFNRSGATKNTTGHFQQIFTCSKSYLSAAQRIELCKGESSASENFRVEHVTLKRVSIKFIFVLWCFTKRILIAPRCQCLYHRLCNLGIVLSMIWQYSRSEIRNLPFCLI